MSLRPPVAYIIYNRPRLVARSLGPIAKARPSRLYIIADGPKRDKGQAEIDLVQQTRSAVEQLIDWSCDVIKIYADENMGCGQRISSGISEVFSHEDEAIIVEDDCVASEEFFTYCEQLLEHYQDVPEVMHISGNHFLNEAQSEASYYFSKYSHCWGWASWARAWRHFDLELHDWQQVRQTAHAPVFSHYPEAHDYWEKTYDLMISPDRHDTWDISWLYAVMTKGLSVYPNANLVSNVGAGDDATHTHDDKHGQLYLPTSSIMPLTHPQEVQLHEEADQRSFEKVFRPIKLYKSSKR